MKNNKFVDLLELKKALLLKEKRLIASINNNSIVLLSNSEYERQLLRTGGVPQTITTGKPVISVDSLRDISVTATIRGLSR